MPGVPDGPDTARGGSATGWRRAPAASYFFRVYLNTDGVGLPELVHASSW